jgi:hypothetical protein
MRDAGRRLVGEITSHSTHGCICTAREVDRCFNITLIPSSLRYKFNLFGRRERGLDFTAGARKDQNTDPEDISDPEKISFLSLYLNARVPKPSVLHRQSESTDPS